MQKNGILPQQRNRHVKTRMHTSQFNKHLSSQTTNHKYFPFVESDKDLHDKIREDMTGGPSIVFRRKAVIEPTSCIQIIYVNLSWVLMIVTSIPFQCVKKCQQVYTHDGSSTQILKNSKLEPINLEHMRTWSCLISNHNAQNAQSKTIIQPGNRKRLTVLAWTVFVLISTQYSKPWVVISIFADAKNLEQASRRRKCREESEKENMMN